MPATDLPAALDHRTTDIHTITEELIDFLGQTLVAALSGTRDRQLPAGWATPDGAAPDQDCEWRLRLAYRVLLLLGAAQPAELVRAWFIGTVADSDPVDLSPIFAIRNGDADLVLTAALWFAAEPAAA